VTPLITGIVHDKGNWGFETAFLDLPEQITDSFGIDIPVIGFIDHSQGEGINSTQNIEPFSSMSPSDKTTDFCPKIPQHGTKNKVCGINKKDLTFTLLCFF